MTDRPVRGVAGAVSGSLAAAAAGQLTLVVSGVLLATYICNVALKPGVVLWRSLHVQAWPHATSRPPEWYACARKWARSGRPQYHAHTRFRGIIGSSP